DLDYLTNIGFIQLVGTKISFQHYLIYESVQRNLSRSEILDFNRVIFFFYNRNKSNTTLEKLTKHAAIATLYSHAGVYAKQLADRLYTDGHYELSLEYYEYYLDHLAECSSKEKLIARTTNVFVKVQSLHVILGSYADMENTSHTLIELSEKTTVKQQLEIYTALTRSSWVLGNLHEAKNHAQKNIDIAQQHGIHDAEIAASFRYGSIHSELGHFLKTLAINENIQQQITPEEYEQKFGLFPMLYPGVTSINSICHAELGNYDESLKYCNLSANFVHGCSDKFTKIFVGVHVGYSLFLLGRLSDALTYLQDVQKIIKTTKASLFAIECQSMIGACQLYLGHYDEGAENVKTAYDLTNTTLQGNKRGMSDLHYLESLLVQFDTEQLSEIINIKIKEAQTSGQESYVAWMYFSKAIYKAFYKRSLTGFVGALAESSKRAQELQMGALLDNIIYLTRIEKTGLLGFQDKAQPTRLLNKAEFFFGLTQNIKPIHFHKKE
ncbi:MAG: hypothetical protein JKY11_08685, partial [Alphaproteobacteria bacterium]|nr:hypothetical protein [Alphaproteobacteria bacterium]